MTKAYHDIDAVTLLLEEREQDLELAAKIGKELLEKNRDLQSKSDFLEEQLNNERETVAQLRHDLHLKEELLAIYVQDDESNEESVQHSLGNSDSTGMSIQTIHLTNLERKVKNLEEENMHLKLEKSKLSKATDGMEEREQHLVKDCIRELAEANIHIRGLSDNLNQKTDLYISQQSEITQLLTKTVEQDSQIKRLSSDKGHLEARLREAQSAQKALTSELGELHDKFDECLGLLDEAQMEIRTLKKKQKAAKYTPLNALGVTHHPAGFLMPYSSPAGLYTPSRAPSESDGLIIGLPPSNYSVGPPTYPQNLATELEYSTARIGGEERISDNLRALQTAKTVRTSSRPSSGEKPSFEDAQRSLTESGYMSSGSNATSFISQLNSLNQTGDGEQRDRSDSSVFESLYNDSLNCSTPGYADMSLMLRRMSREQDRRHKAVTQRYRYAAESVGSVSPMSTPLMTPDNLSLNGSPPNPPCPFSSDSPPKVGDHQMRVGLGIAPEKLQLVKPLAGSLTLGHWQRLATPGLQNATLDDLPGVQIRGQPLKTDSIDESVTDIDLPGLSDIEEDDDFCRVKMKNAENGSMTYTYTTAKILHPSDVYTETSSSTNPKKSLKLNLPVTSTCTTSSAITSSGIPLHLSRTPSRPSRADATSTFSLSFGLADVLKERGIRSLAPNDIVNRASLDELHTPRSRCPSVSESTAPEEEVTPTQNEPWFLPSLGFQLNGTLKNLLQGVSLITGPQSQPQAATASKAVSTPAGTPCDRSAGLNFFLPVNNQTASSEAASVPSDSPFPKSKVIHRVSSLSPQD